MTTELIISACGAVTAILVSILGAYLANRNSETFQIRKLKQEHYISFIESLHNNAANNSKETLIDLTFRRDKMLLIAGERVIKKLLDYEDQGIKGSKDQHDRYLTELVKEIRKDLKIKDRDFPKIGFKKATKSES